MDNIPFEKVTHFDDDRENVTQQGGRFSVFSPGLIDGAEFQGVGFPAKYGGKNASLLGLSVKEGNRDDFSLRGHYDLLGWEATYDGPVTGLRNTGVILSAREQDFKRIIEMIDEKSEGYPGFSDFIFKITSDINSRNKVSLLGIYAPENYDRDIDHVYESEGLTDNQIVDQYSTKSLIGLNLRTLTSKSSFLTTTFYNTNSELDEKLGRIYTDPVTGQYPAKENAESREDYWNSKENETVVGMKSEFIKSFTNGSILSTGIESQWKDYDLNNTLNGVDTLYTYNTSDFRPDPQQNFLVLDPANINADYNKQNYNLSAYSQYKYQVTNKLTAIIGPRVEYSEINKDVNVSPRVSVRYRYNNKTALSAAAGVYYQEPAMLIVGAINSPHDLKSERSSQFILGLSRYIRNDLKFTVDTYYKYLDNLITKPDGGMNSYNRACCLKNKIAQNVWCRLSAVDTLSLH